MTTYWSRLPLGLRSIKVQTIQEGPDFAKILKVNLTREFFQDLKGRLNAPRQNLSMSGSGKKRTGKSWTYMSIIEYAGNVTGIMPDIDNVVFSADDALKRVGRMGRKEQLIEDEQVTSFGMGSGAEQANLENLEKTIGKSEIFFYFLSPNIEPHNHDYYTETWMIGRTDRDWNWDRDSDVDWTQYWERTMSLIYDGAGDILLGYIITDSPKDMDFVAKYEAKKDKAIEMFRKQEVQTRFRGMFEDAETLADNKEFKKLWLKTKSKVQRTNMMLIALKGKNYTGDQVKSIVNYVDAYYATGTNMKKIEEMLK